MPLRIGLAGYGRRGRSHIKAVEEIEVAKSHPFPIQSMPPAKPQLKNSAISQLTRRLLTW